MKAPEAEAPEAEAEAPEPGGMRVADVLALLERHSAKETPKVSLWHPPEMLFSALSRQTRWNPTLETSLGSP